MLNISFLFLNLELVEALESYSSHLERSFIKIALPPIAPGTTVPPTFDLSPSYITALDNEFTRVYEEYNGRVHMVKSIGEEMIKLWAELGTPQAQTDSSIVKYYKDAPEQLGLHDTDMAKLKGKRDKLVEEKKSRERRLKELKLAVESLWERLGVEECDKKAFIAANRGCGLRTINEFEEELNRLNELKRQNLHLFVEDARCKIQELWDELYYSEEEMLDFTPAFSDVYSDALLEAHEAEIARLQAIKEQRAPVLELIGKHKALVQDRETLNASSQDASRLMARGNKGEKRDPGKLLREEKMRKRISKELPKVEAELRKFLEKYENEYGRPFLVHGESYLDELTATGSKVPPRSKTPSMPPSTVRLNVVRPTPSGQNGTINRNAAPSRATTKTPSGNDTIKRNPVPCAATRSPSKIPARVPLGNMPHGNNSPERRPPPAAYSTSTIRGKIPPHAPPPKMRALVPQPMEEKCDYLVDPARCGSVMSSRSVKPIALEDVYDDRMQTSYMSNSVLSSRKMDNISQGSHSAHSSSSREGAYPTNSIYLQNQAAHSAMRQISNSSTVHTTASGSENWETYDDTSEPEVDASDVYYAKLRAAHGKRLAAGEIHNGTVTGKKIKGIRNVGLEERMIEQDGHFIRIEGSDGGWTDDMEVY